MKGRSFPHLMRGISIVILLLAAQSRRCRCSLRCVGNCWRTVSARSRRNIALIAPDRFVFVRQADPDKPLS
jgi:hypothetical protein